MKYLQHTYTRVSEQRNKRRIWLQGLRLRAAGFDKGTRYRIDYDMDSKHIYLVVDPNGNRQVSGRKKGERYDPIVDICNAEITLLTEGYTRVRADFAEGFIRIAIHHHDSREVEREDRLQKNLENNELREGALCAGIGMATAAIHEGLQDKGIRSRVEWIVDRDRRYLQVAADNNPAVTASTVLFEASLEEIEPELLAPVDLVQVSLPCTGHSISGKVKNKLKLAEEHATDATALFGLMRVIECVNPAIIISENVTQARDSASYLLIKGMLAQLGYNIHEAELDHRQAGSFERRKRYWFVAISRGLRQIDFSDIPMFACQYQVLGDLLEPVSMKDASWSDNTYLKKKACRDKQAGKGFANRQLVGADAPYVTTIGRHYNKRRSTEPMLTRSDGKERLLTPVEHCRAKGAPESLIEDVSATLAHEGLGQGIIWGQGVGIGQLLAAQVLHVQTAVDSNHQPGYQQDSEEQHV